MNILESLLIGFAIAVIPGPIFFEVTRRSLAHGFRGGFMVLWGEFVANLILLLAIFFGLSPMLGFVWVKAGLYLLGAAILIYIGQSAFRTTVMSIEAAYKTKEFRASNSFLAGFWISLSSPITISFWISLAGSYLSEFSRGMAAFHIFLIAFGFLLFFIPLAIAVSYSQKKLKPTWVVWLSWVFGVVLIVYGGKFLYDLVRLFV